MIDLKNSFQFVDMTHELSSSVPSWSGGCGFSHRNQIDYSDCTTETKFRVQEISMVAGVGTHIDAPAHCIPGGKDISELPISHLISSCVVIDVSSRSHAEYTVSPSEIIEFEKKQGSIEEGDIVLINTGWEKYWNDPERYRNGLTFPGISAESALLLKERKVSGVGIDTLGIDRPSSGFPAHRILLGAGIFLIENVASMSQMPTRGGYLICLPMKGVGLTESPVRLVGLKNRIG